VLDLADLESRNPTPDVAREVRSGECLHDREAGLLAPHGERPAVERVGELVDDLLGRLCRALL
jgi:hypothetical protein